MLIENETKNIFDKKIIKNKIPKSKKSAKNIPFPNNKYNKNIKTLLPIRQSSTIILKENPTNLSQKYPSENNFQRKNITKSLSSRRPEKICNRSKIIKRKLKTNRLENIFRGFTKHDIT